MVEVLLQITVEAVGCIGSKVSLVCCVMKGVVLENFLCLLNCVAIGNRI